NISDYASISIRQITQMNRYIYQSAFAPTGAEKETDQSYPEVFLVAGWSFKKQNARFNPTDGITMGSVASVNIIPYQQNAQYLQLAAEARYYHPGFKPGHRLAARVRPLIRFGSGTTIYNGLDMGDQNTLRGFGSGFFCSSTDRIYNNRLLATAEYRFYLMDLPPLRLPWFSWYHSSLSNFALQLDGAFFADGGYLWKEWNHPLEPIHHERSGASSGCALRVHAPSLNQSVCFDVAWRLYPSRYVDFTMPVWYLYVDLMF
ncbi:MAG: BamA/TamA family outer membrane protein, partial [Chitinivibrionales bacterium]|nr:BamA/TamA family outer membrane protein [Chitinivibrionales bacterium]